jgi:hypothetical protein
MNLIEREMSSILKTCKEEYGVIAVKAEFEAEGTRMDELLRLVEIAHSVNLDLTVKIGGCEAIRDLYESKQIGVQYIVAPMVETAYAASKFALAKNLVYDEEEKNQTEFLINVETDTAVKNFAGIIKVAVGNNSFDGFVFGRVDYVGSKGLERKEVDSAGVLSEVLKLSDEIRKHDKKLVVGGGVSADSIEFLREVASVHLSRFETRKVVFDGQSAFRKDISRGLLLAVKFELLWLKNKQSYYGRIHHEDDLRINMLENRWSVLGKDI